ncbi:NAD(P)H-quinone oxidoreductase subunit 2 [Thermodesulfobium narugense DSM 14796]|uniref:NADH-quinone oxidoreductase subunit N n=1 Tax=Thermodesulfobium narugense DSM 14796 TaxID=747365 RepID=M1E9I7_9BACT|nr:NADH-quinone oxidoreductase subunit N [Thermodesulfobium narugense]AEE15349.1 NAD(P)H-quinone oxidoreductase subunit 2 [Thermodesulfobium narugense DSM 14796]
MTMFKVIAPELFLIACSISIFLSALFIKNRRTFSILAILGLLIAGVWKYSLHGAIFNLSFSVDSFDILGSWIIILIAVYVILISIDDIAIPNTSYGEFLTLILTSVVGMLFMIGSRDLIILYLGLETLSLSLYILCSFYRKDKLSSEAGLKYYLMGTVATAILLYGIALIYGATGTTNFYDITKSLSSTKVLTDPMFIAGVVAVIVTFSFKSSVIPFHAWTPDTYQGAPTPITAFLATAPKTALLLAFGRFFIGSLIPIWIEPKTVLIVLSIFTMVGGNLLALSQKNVKRMLAFSSVSHVGYMLLGIIVGTQEGLSAILTYLIAYAIMNLGAFGVVFMLKNGDDMSTYNGLAKRYPYLAGIMMIFMFSLAGIPPTVGFIAKFQLFLAAVNAGLTSLVIIAVLMTITSAFYYLRIVMNMYMKEPDAETEVISSDFTKGLVLSLSILVIVLGTLPSIFIH